MIRRLRWLKWLTSTYLIRLGLVGLLSLAGILLLWNLAHTQAIYISLTSSAQQQRESSEQVVFQALLLITDDGGQREWLRGQLRRSAAELQSAYARLRRAANQSQLPLPAELDLQTRSFLQHARTLAASDTAQLALNNTDFLTLRNSSQHSMQHSLDLIIDLYAPEGQLVSEILGQRERSAFLFIAAATVTTVFWVMLPLFRQLRREAEQLAKLSLVAQHTDNAVIITDALQRIEWVNAGFTRITGYSAAEVLGKIPGQFLQGPETDPMTVQQITQELQALQPSNTEILNYDKQGRPYWLAMSISPIFDPQGQLSRFIAIESDITARKQLERSLRDSEARLRTLWLAQQAILDSARHTIIATDLEGCIVSLNPAVERLLGYTAEELVGKASLLALHDPQELEQYARRRSAELNLAPASGFDLISTCAREAGMAHEWTYLRRDGSRLPVELTISGLYDHQGELNGFLAIASDISERKAVERIKSEFISIVSHELRTPLTSIRGSLGLINGGVLGELPAQIRTMIEIAYKNSERLVRLINDILDIDKIESGKMSFRCQALPLRSLLEHALEANRAYGQNLGVRFELLEPVPDVLISVDEDRMMQVLANLLSNAAKFSPTGAVVQLGASADPQQVRISVIDYGCGIPEEFRSRIFQKFAQADSSATRQRGGTGLGLSIVKAIVERMGGQVGFISEAGQGSTFFVDLPRLAEAPTLPAAPPPDQRRVLICEADPETAQFLALLLAQRNYHTDIAHDVAEARLLLAEHDYLGMTLSLLPTHDGVELIRELRDTPRTRNLPIVVVSARGNPAASALDGVAVEIIDWLPRPINHERFLSAIARAEQSGQQRKLRVLHIEDDPDVVQVVATLIGERAQVLGAPGLLAAQRALEQQHFDLAIVDLQLPDGSGLDVLPLLNARQPAIPALIFAAEDLSLAGDAITTLVKSRTSNQALLDAISAALEQRVPAEGATIGAADYAVIGTTSKPD